MSKPVFETKVVATGMAFNLLYEYNQTLPTDKKWLSDFYTKGDATNGKIKSCQWGVEFSAIAQKTVCVTILQKTGLFFLQ